ncbi:hypothetical protein D3C80_2041510 [compost metagenome]
MGEKNLITSPGKSNFGSEDFAWMLERRPGCYVAIGNGDGVATGCEVHALHNPGYDFNDQVIAYGASYWARLVQTYLV